MKKFIKRSKKKGFTLMELLVSLGIVAALSMMVAPMIMGKVDEAKVKADISNANAIAVAVKSEILKGEIALGTIEATELEDLTDLIGEYFDGQLPTPQSAEGEFTVTVTGNTVEVSASKDSVIKNYYPADPSLLAP